MKEGVKESGGCLILIAFLVAALVAQWSGTAAVAIILVSVVAGFLLSLRSRTVRLDHLVHGHKEGNVEPQGYRVVVTSPSPPIDAPVVKKGRFSALDEPEQMTRYVSQALDLPAILQHCGLVLYRPSEEDALDTERALHELLDPRFPAPVTTYVERWNADLELWQKPQEAGGDDAGLAALGWQVRARLPDKAAARATAARIRESGEVMVGLSRRVVTVGCADQTTARLLAGELAAPGADVKVRRMTRLHRARLRATLYDRRRHGSGGWFEYDEPAPA